MTHKLVFTNQFSFMRAVRGVDKKRKYHKLMDMVINYL